MSEGPLPTLLDPAGNAHPLAGAEMGIGRAVENEIVITSNRVSREHARIYRDGWKVMLADLGSKNGTYLNGERLLEPRQLQEGDRIKVGDVVFLFQDPDSTVQDSPLPELAINEAVAEVRVDRQLISLAPKEYALVNFLYQTVIVSVPRMKSAWLFGRNTRMVYSITRSKILSAVCAPSWNRIPVTPNS